MKRRINRVDHLGEVAGVIKDLGIVEFIDARIPPDEKEGKHRRSYGCNHY